MTDQARRYDSIAEGYARWWAPFLVPAAHDLLTRLAPELPSGPIRLLDVGTGTGTLGIAAAERWPETTVVAIDASTEMAAAARAAAVRRLGPGGVGRFTVEVASADRLPFQGDAFDAAMSSFVLQLVPNRHRALREIRRVLRPNAPFGLVTWLRDASSWRPDEIVDEVLDELEVGPGGDDDDPDVVPDAGDPASVGSAVAELRRAGFRAVDGTEERLEIAFDVDGYLGFLTEFDDPTLFESLDDALRARVLARLRDRLSALDPGDLTMTAPIVHVIGRRSR